MNGWDNGLNQDYCRELGRWFADRLGAREELRRTIDMIRNNPAHDTEHPAGTFVPKESIVRHFPAFKQSKSLAQEVAEYLEKEEKLKKTLDKK